MGSRAAGWAIAALLALPSVAFGQAPVNDNYLQSLRLNLPDGITLPVPSERTHRYQAYAGSDVIFGIRPEHLTEVKPTSKRNIATFEAKPQVIEPMGMETLVHFWLEGSEVSARIDPAVRAEVGRPLALAADLDQMHLIDPQTDRVL